MLADPAGNDDAIEREIGAQVEREAVHRDPARDAHADRAELDEVRARARCPGNGVRRARSAHRPTCFSCVPASMPSSLDKASHRLGEILHVAAHVAPIGRKIEDRVAHELSRCVQRHVAAASRVARARCRARASDSARREEVLGVGAAPERDRPARARRTAPCRRSRASRRAASSRSCSAWTGS